MNTLAGFPSAHEVAEKSVRGGLKETLKAIERATLRGSTNVVIRDKSEIKFIFNAHENFEALGYELSYQFPEELSWELDEVTEDVIEWVIIRWGHHIYKRN